MANYILSNANRFYAAIENQYGELTSVSAADRFPAFRLDVQQTVEQIKRRDKTGSRTFSANRPGRKRTMFEVQTYLSFLNTAGPPSFLPLLRSTLGGTPQSGSGMTLQPGSTVSHIQTTVAHGLSTGTAVAYGNEIRFVSNVTDSTSFDVNAPFASAPTGGSLLRSAVTLRASAALPSLSIYDYWSPSTNLQRVLAGAVVDRFDLVMDGDLHELTFRGAASDVIDSVNLASGLSSFPAEPPLSSVDYSVLPGDTGQVWLGSAPSRFFTLANARIRVENDVQWRDREYGFTGPRAAVPGHRSVNAQLNLFAQDDVQTKALYQAARQRAALPVMLQLGQKAGQLMGIYLPRVTPEIPDYDDAEARLIWKFQNCQASGQVDDEIVFAFG